MATVTFDTLKFVKTLKEAGISEPQAEAFSTAVRESHEAADVATKGDITDLRHEMKELETGLRHEIKELETGLRHEIKELETNLRHEIGDLRHEVKEFETGLRHEIGDLRHEMKELDSRRQGEMLLLKWMLGILIAGMASLVLKAFFGA